MKVYVATMYVCAYITGFANRSLACAIINLYFDICFLIFNSVYVPQKHTELAT